MSISSLSAQDYVASLQSALTDQTGATTTDTTIDREEFAALLTQLLSQIMVTCPHCGEQSSLTDSGSEYSASDSALYDTLTSVAPNPVTPNMLNTGANPEVTGPNGTLKNIKWEGRQNLGNWQETVHMDITQLGDGKIRWQETGDRSTWGAEDGTDANIWLIRETSSGQYEARTWEWLRPGQTLKNTENIYDMWAPEPGEKVGFMIAGKTRNGTTPNAMQRSNIDWVTWPG